MVKEMEARAERNAIRHREAQINSSKANRVRGVTDRSDNKDKDTVEADSEAFILRL